MMWQEARKQEKKIRGMLVDYKRRAERRKDYYEKIKAEPTQFIQLHGRPCKIHLDPAVAIAGDSPANMMSWQGNHDILIDRFDVRAHLDFISENKSSNDEEEEFSQEERLINYERYRILAQNDFLGVTEDKFLHQLAIEEQFGPVEKTEPPPIEGKKKVVGAAIGYNYGEGTVAGGEPARAEKQSSDESEEEEEDEDSDIDFDLCVDVNKISSAQAHEMNTSALAYGMVSNDFFSYLTKDVEEAENLKIAREREEEKAMFSGRKSRRERRAFREKKLIGRKLSPPSYAASKEAPIADLIRTVTKSRSKSRSRSASPPNAGMIQYITSFGGDEVPLEPPPPQTIKTSVHPSKEEDKVYKRTVRYRSSRSPESGLLRNRSVSPKSSHKYRSTSRSRETSPTDSRRTRSKSRSRSPRRHSKSPDRRTVRYRSRTPSPTTTRANERTRSSREYERTSSTSYRRRQSLSKSRSKSPFQRIVKKTSPAPVRSVEVPAPPVITRYYGRRKNESSSSELDLSDSESKSETSDRFSSSNKNSQPVGNSGGRSKPATPATAASKLSLQERLKKKRQALINRQYKADKKAERLRQEKAEQERQDREDEMREISIKMRRRERQKRHQYYELDESNAAELSDTDDDRLSGATSDSTSDKNGSDAELSSRSRARKIKDPDKSRTSRERSRERDSRRDSDSRRDDENRRDRDRSEDRDRRRRFRDEERPRGRDRSRDKYRERSRDRDRYRRERDRSRERGRGWSRERERYSGRRSRSRDRDEEGSGYYAAKKPIRPLVDY